MTEESAAADPIRLFLLDDHELVRAGLKSFFGATADITVVGEASRAADALDRAREARPDVALLDVQLPDGSGIDVCRDILAALPGTRCVILTSHDDDEAVFAAVMAGASGYLLKDVAGGRLITGIRQVAAGQSLLDPAVTGRVLERLRRPEAPTGDRFASLTDRDRQILELVAEGLTNREIGARLYLAEKTVKNYVSALLLKLGMQRRTQIAAYAASQQAR